MERLRGVGLGQLPEDAKGQGREGARTRDRKWLLVLVDGTWAQAKRMVRDSPSLRAHTTQVRGVTLGTAGCQVLPLVAAGAALRIAAVDIQFYSAD